MGQNINGGHSGQPVNNRKENVKKYTSGIQEHGGQNHKYKAKI